MFHDRKPCPSDVSDDEWSLVSLYLTLMIEAPQRDYPLRKLFNGPRYVVRYGIAWQAIEPLRVFRRLFSLPQAAMAYSSAGAKYRASASAGGISPIGPNRR
jgi:hypothetical protein